MRDKRGFFRADRHIGRRTRADEPSPPIPSMSRKHEKLQTKKFYFCVANADFMLNDENNEHFPEVLRERRRFYR